MALTRRKFLGRTGAAIGAAALLPLARLVPSARAAGVFADEATYLFDPGSRIFEPDPAIWERAGELTPVAIPGRGLGAEGVGSMLSYTHYLPPLLEGQGGAVRAQLFLPPPDDGAWLDDAISTRLTLDDGVGQVTVAPARDPATGGRELRVEGAATRLSLPFPWDNGYANIVDIERRPDGQFALTATNLDPAGDGTSNTIAFGEGLVGHSGGRPLARFGWDREGRSQADSSCWVRVSTAWAGKGWGSFLPEKDDEVIVDFLEGDPDRPIITGSVYNADRLPLPQPADPQSDVWILRTASGGGFHNEFTSIPEAVRFDRGQQVFVFRLKERAEKLEMRFLPLDPPLLWGFELEARRSPALFPLALARSRTGELASVLHVELQIGDMTGSQTYRLCGSDGRLSSC